MEQRNYLLLVVAKHHICKKWKKEINNKNRQKNHYVMPCFCSTSKKSNFLIYHKENISNTCELETNLNSYLGLELRSKY